jgi:hypothetical protein
MNTRMRSPSYPGTPLEKAVDFVAKIHRSERQNPVDRDVAVQAMGYSGLSGRAAKVLSDLIQYSLLEKAGKNEVRVSTRAVEILHPESPDSRSEALKAAAFEPDLFQRIKERFPDGQPSEAALRSYFVREDFTDAAIPRAIRAYFETCQFLETANVSESHSRETRDEAEPQRESSGSEGGSTRSSTTDDHARFWRDHGFSHQMEMSEYAQHLFDPVRKRMKLGTWISTQEEADEAISFIQAIRGFLPNSTAQNAEAMKLEQRSAVDRWEESNDSD